MFKTHATSLKKTCTAEAGIKLQLFDGEPTIISSKCNNYFNE